jgi:hypothetical protein
MANPVATQTCAFMLQHALNQGPSAKTLCVSSSARLLCNVWLQLHVGGHKGAELRHGCYAPKKMRNSAAAADCGAGSVEDSITLSSIESLHYGDSMCKRMSGRGTITMISSHVEFPVLRVTVNRAQSVFANLTQVCP